jgi:hypothetical protein
MPNDIRGFQPSGGLDGTASEIQAFEVALRGPAYGTADAADRLKQTDQLARDIADIERATAALRRAQPGLEAWTEPATDDRSAGAMRKARPVWPLIGLLWLSTALVTVGAVAAIARLAG